MSQVIGYLSQYACHNFSSMLQLICLFWSLIRVAGSSSPSFSFSSSCNPSSLLLHSVSPAIWDYPETIRNSTFGVDTPLPPPHFGTPTRTGATTHPASPQAPCPFMITLELSGNYTEFHVRDEDSLRTFIIVYRISKLIHTFWSQEGDFS